MLFRSDHTIMIIWVMKMFFVKVRSGGCEEIPHIQGKRNPSKMVDTERGDQRADRLKLQSQTTSQSDHTDHSLV